MKTTRIRGRVSEQGSYTDAEATTEMLATRGTLPSKLARESDHICKHRMNPNPKDRPTFVSSPLTSCRQPLRLALFAGGLGYTSSFSRPPCLHGRVRQSGALTSTLNSELLILGTSLEANTGKIHFLMVHTCLCHSPGHEADGQQ